MMDKRDNLWKEPVDISDSIPSIESGEVSITSIEQDEDGWVWIGTSGSGVHRLSNVDGPTSERSREPIRNRSPVWLSTPILQL